jgi:uncharacterized protein (DUF1501 family)
MRSTPFTRRRFIGAGAAGAVGVLAATQAWPRLDGAASTPAAAPASSKGGATLSSGNGILVLVTLYGGNDGLNTVVPASDSAYQAARPSLGYKPNEVLDLADGLGLNPKLANLAKLWKAGQLAVVRGVGYPGPNLSHFDSMDIWQTANPISGTGPGWLGKWLDGTSGDPLRAVSVGATLPTVLRGERTAACALTSTTITLPGSVPSKMALSSLMAPAVDRQGMGAAVASSGRELLAAQAELDALPQKGLAHPSARAAARGASLADQLQIVATLIRAGAPGRVYQVSLSSFDTHADEKTAHEAKLAELDAGIAALFAGLDGAPAARDVVLMTYSEFGRRVAQNASGGTDHGTAAPLFVVGAGVKGGAFFGEEPSLTALDPNGNLVSTVDFRSVYATVLERVIGADPTQVLGATYPILDFV